MNWALSSIMIRGKCDLSWYMSLEYVNYANRYQIISLDYRKVMLTREMMDRSLEVNES